MRKKTVQVLGHEFDSLPADVTIAGKGTGSNLGVAVRRAMMSMLRDPRLRHKQTGTFKLAVVVTVENSIAKGGARDGEE